MSRMGVIGALAAADVLASLPVFARGGWGASKLAASNAKRTIEVEISHAAALIEGISVTDLLDRWRAGHRAIDS